VEKETLRIPRDMRASPQPSTFPFDVCSDNLEPSRTSKGTNNMAANSTTEHTTTASAARDITAYDLVIALLAVFSLIILALLIFVPLSPSTADILNALENLLCIVFLFDFFRSLFRAQNKWRYFLRGGGWLDLLGSLPFSRLAVFRIFRLFRVVRVMRTLKGNDYRKMLTGRLAENTLLFTLVVALVLIFTIAGIVLYAEQGAPNANIKTYHDAVWWAFVTITTVGYGDFYPVTTLGQSMAIILMFFGLGIIGVLSSYLASTFISRQSRRRERLEAGKNDDVDNQEDEDNSTSRDAELAAIKEELAALRKLLEEHYQIQ
jgi:voltage-gated potassium channel